MSGLWTVRIGFQSIQNLWLVSVFYFTYSPSSAMYETAHIHIVSLYQVWICYLFLVWFISSFLTKFQLKSIVWRNVHVHFFLSALCSYTTIAIRNNASYPNWWIMFSWICSSDIIKNFPFHLHDYVDLCC